MKRTKLRVTPQTGAQEKVAPRYDCIKLGIDWHAGQYRVSRIIDNGGPEPGQRFKPEAFLVWAKKQLSLAKRVVCCYEAGSGGYVLHRQLVAMGIENIVVTPRKLDPNNRGVQTDKTDARDLVMNLDSYVKGNDRSLRRVFVPTPEQEQARAQSRQRKQLQQKRLAIAAQGRSLLLCQGRRESNQWWKPNRWLRLAADLPGWMVEILATYREIIVQIQRAVDALRRKIEKTAPNLRPRGLGALGFEEIRREVADFNRFRKPKSPGSYVGLTGGVSATDKNVQDLALTKAGNRRLRSMLIESAWRWVLYQPQCKLVQRWRGILLNPEAHRRGRKRAIVAVARQLFVDLWRWQTGRATPEQLGWVMINEADEHGEAAKAA